MRLAFAVFAVLLPIAGARAQPVTITGQVRDARTGAPLEAASLLVEGTQRGTIANLDGRYALRLDTLPARVLVRFLGYQPGLFTVHAGQAVYDVALEPATLALADVVVSAEDPAVRIMRRVIENKKKWRALFSAYRAEAYARIVVRNDTGIVQVEEVLTRVYWREKGGFREVVRGRRKSANSEVGDVLPAAALVRNLYDDDVEIGGFTFVGVTHPDALDVYRFTLRGLRDEDGQTVYDIAVAPQNPLAVAFEGRVAVRDSAFALVEAELRPGPAFRFPPPIQRYETALSQQFYAFGTGAWLPVDYRQTSSIEVGMPGLLHLPTLHVQQTVRLSDYALDAPIPDSLYRDRDAPTAVDSAAVRADTLLDASGVRVPLTDAERAALAGLDSTDTLDKTFKPTGPLARFVQFSGGGDGEGRAVAFDWSPRLWYNRVEAIHAGAALTARVRHAGALKAEVGYETALRRIGVAFEVRAGRRLYAVAGYENGAAARYASAVETPLFNSFDVLLNRGDYYDYSRRERLRGGVGWQPRRTEWDVVLGVQQEQHRALDALADLYTVHGTRHPRPNPALATPRFTTLSGDARWGGDAEGLGFIPLKRLHVGVERAVDGLAFGRLYGDADYSVVTFGRRRFLPARLELRLTGQYGWGEVPPVRWDIVEASNRFATPFGSLRTLQPLPYLGRSAVALHWEHNFRTLPFELIGWEWAARRNLSVLVHGGHARTWGGVGGARRSPAGGHHELGASLGGLFTYFRLDVTARLDAPALTVGIAPARFF